mmetsp:Transcript_43545/g.112794  ORF Transcript_43545/g.112794 Transcript_43545/m.112794 type:complete len:446 (+) Transcript_43545:104-1441(+)
MSFLAARRTIISAAEQPDIPLTMPDRVRAAEQHQRAARARRREAGVRARRGLVAALRHPLPRGGRSGRVEPRRQRPRVPPLSPRVVVAAKYDEEAADGAGYVVEARHGARGVLVRRQLLPCGRPSAAWVRFAWQRHAPRVVHAVALSHQPAMHHEARGPAAVHNHVRVMGGAWLRHLPAAGHAMPAACSAVAGRGLMQPEVAEPRPAARPGRAPGGRAPAEEDQPAAGEVAQGVALPCRRTPRRGRLLLPVRAIQRAQLPARLPPTHSRHCIHQMWSQQVRRVPPHLGDIASGASRLRQRAWLQIAAWEGGWVPGIKQTRGGTRSSCTTSRSARQATPIAARSLAGSLQAMPHSTSCPSSWKRAGAAATIAAAPSGGASSAQCEASLSLPGVAAPSVRCGIVTQEAVRCSGRGRRRSAGGPGGVSQWPAPLALALLWLKLMQHCT